MRQTVDKNVCLLLKLIEILNQRKKWKSLQSNAFPNQNERNKKKKTKSSQLICVTFWFATNAKVILFFVCVYVSVRIECCNVDFIITLILISCADTWALKKFNRMKSFRQKLPFHICTILISQINHSHPKHAVENCSVTHSKRNEKTHTHT